MAKYHENLLKDSTLSLLFIVKLFSSLEKKKTLKMPNETFLKITRYFFLMSSFLLLLLQFLSSLRLSVLLCCCWWPCSRLSSKICKAGFVPVVVDLAIVFSAEYFFIRSPFHRILKILWITVFYWFLDAFSHLYKRVCPYVRRSVHPSVRRLHTS